MSAKHTPGPWKVRPEIDGPSGNTRIVAADGKDIGRTTRHCARHNHHKDAEANALLIAAAPDLLEALKGMVAWFSCERRSAPVDAAKAAIAKAEGAQ